MTKKQKKSVPVEAALELADKSAQAARVGGDAEQGAKNIQIDVDYLRTTKVHCAMPCYGGMLTESTFMSFIKFSNICRYLNIEWTMETLANESLISRARNTLVAKFLDKKDSSHLMFIDADIGWEAWHLLVLLDRKVDVIGGLYPLKGLPIKWCVNGIKGSTATENGLQEVSKTGTGFMLIKRDVFTKLDGHPAVKPYKNDIDLDPKYDAYLKTYFDTAVRDNRYLSEDWKFCEDWREMGGRVYIDKRVLLQHTGFFVYSGDNQEVLIPKLGEMHLDNLRYSGHTVTITDALGNPIT